MNRLHLGMLVISGLVAGVTASGTAQAFESDEFFQTSPGIACRASMGWSGYSELYNNTGATQNAFCPFTLSSQSNAQLKAASVVRRGNATCLIRINQENGVGWNFYPSGSVDHGSYVTDDWQTPMNFTIGDAGVIYCTVNAGTILSSYWVDGVWTDFL